MGSAPSLLCVKRLGVGCGDAVGVGPYVVLDRSGRVYEVTVGAEQRPEYHQVLDTMWNCAQGRRPPWQRATRSPSTAKPRTMAGS